MMLTPETLSLRVLSSLLSAQPDSDLKSQEGLLIFSSNGRDCMISITGEHQIRFFMLSKHSGVENAARADVLEAINNINSDLMFATSAYLSEDGQLIFTRAQSVKGGMTEGNFLVSMREFFVECAFAEHTFATALPE